MIIGKCSRNLGSICASYLLWNIDLIFEFFSITKTVERYQKRIQDLGSNYKRNANSQVIFFFKCILLSRLFNHFSFLQLWKISLICVGIVTFAFVLLSLSLLTASERWNLWLGEKDRTTGDFDKVVKPKMFTISYECNTRKCYKKKKKKDNVIV